ncbi:hypothetical protein PFISCL1PPCAC_746, partial [Pristionchus fissidentatus]
YPLRFCDTCCVLRSLTMPGKGKKSGGVTIKKAPAVEKENAPLTNGTAKAKPIDRYADLENKRSAFAEMSSEAKVRAAAAPPIKENAVPVGMRRTDKKNRARYSDGKGSEHTAIHRNGEKAGKTEDVAVTKKMEKTIRQMKEEMAKNGGMKVTKPKTPEQSAKKNEKRKRLADEDEEEVNGTPSADFFKKRLQQLANSAMESEIARNKSKRARNASPSDSGEDEEDADALALVPLPKGTSEPKRRKLASGRVVEYPEFDVQEMTYTVEEPSDEDESFEERQNKLQQQLREKRPKSFKNVDWAAYEREMQELDPYDEERDADFENVSGDEEDDEDEEEEVESGDELDELSDDGMSDEEVSDEELVSSEMDEEDAVIRPEDILRTVNFDEDDGQEEEESDEDEEEDEEGVEMHGCCDNSDCDENGEEMSDEDEYEEVEGDTSDSSSHISDDSYQEAFVDADMASKSVTMTREPAKKSKKAAKSIDFAAFPFKEVDSGVSASKALDWLLSPCDVQTFFEDFFQSTSLVVARKDKNYYGNLFSTGAMTNLLRENCLEYGVNVNVALYENGVRTTHNSTGRAYPLAIGDAIRSGCSVQLTNPQTYSKEIWYLCDTLQEMFHCFVGANTYITPAGASGFAPHWDEIDAFLLQVEGRKYWRVWAPESADTELPLESSGNFTEADMEGRKPAFEGWIESGDLLYIPRGFIHQARTDASVHSLHVTISVGRQWTFSNYFQKLLPAAMEAFTTDRVKLRKQLPAGLLDMTGVAELPDGYPLGEAGERMTSTLDRHMSKFRSFVDGMRESGVDLMAREFMRTALPPLLSNEEKQLSVWGNDGADLFKEKGASRITATSEIRFIKRHGQRLLFESADAPFVVHRMANARVYEGAEERTFTLTVEEEPAFGDLLSAYPEWTTVSELKMKKKAKIAFLTKLFNHGLIMVRSA